MSKIIEASLKAINSCLFHTSGKEESASYIIKQGTSANLAAGKIHTDFVKKFSRARLVHPEVFVAHKGWDGVNKAKAYIDGTKQTVIEHDTICYFEIRN